jgi:hypothetical protein
MGVTVTYVRPMLMPSGTTWAQFQAGGLGTILDNLMAANPAVPAPATQLTVDPIGGGASGGSLPNGTYFVTCTNVGPAGETMAGGESAKFTVAPGNIPRVTFPALPPGVGCRNLYATLARGPAGSEVLYAAGITAVTFDLSIAGYADAAAQPPMSDQSALSNLASLINMGRAHKFDMLYQATAKLFGNFAAGRAMLQQEMMTRTRQHAAVFTALKVAVDEAASLIHANTGTLTTAPTSNAVNVITVRTFP